MSDDPVVGALTIKIVVVDPDTETVYFRTVDGRTGWTSAWNGPLPQRGEIFLQTEDGWESLPAETWPERNSIAVVQSILEDGTILLDDSLSIRKTHNDHGISIAPHNTVEYNDIDGVINIISERPIRSRDFVMDSGDATKAFLVSDSPSSLTFNDFGGYPRVIERAKELIETQLEKRSLLESIGARPVKGVLFTGAPGTGKTHLAKIIADESKAAFYLISGPSIVSKWVGDTEETLRSIFDAAAESDRAIIFIDEIDSIAERRSDDSHEASKRLVAQLLTLMDGFETRDKNVVVIAATNRAETLDPALMRPGRFDWEIQFGLPDALDRLAILQVRARGLKTSGELHLEQIAEMSSGWSAADLTAIWTEAALVTVADGRGAISGEDLAQAYERLLVRPRREQLLGGSE